jgi:hypothetical protein
MINFYEVLPKQLKKKPKFDKNTMMELPFRLACVGSSGAGKTNWLLNLIKLQSGNFDRIVVCTKNKSEPLYQFLEMKIDSSQLEIYEGIEQIPDVDTYKDSKESILAVFDDLMLEKDQKVIEEYFIRGRKVAGGISCCYLSQSFVKIPMTIRRNVSYVILKKISSMKDITMILKNYSLECSKEALINMYNKATAKQTDFLMVDLSAPDNKRFRHNFKTIVNLC